MKGRLGMAKAKSFEKCALVVGILSSAQERKNELFAELEKAFGPVFSVSPVMEFPYTDYYDSEMGSRPVRYFIMFSRLIDPSQLAAIKTKTNEIEKLFTVDGGRHINIDPGLLTLSSLILATCKNRSHRIPLSDGIYAEVTLIYQDGDFQRQSWTYADYSADEVRSVLCSFRDALKTLMKSEPR